MKKALLLIFAVLPFTVLAQSFKIDENTKSSHKDKPAYLLDTVATSEYSKSQLYSNALNYATTTFKDSRSVIEFKDAELGEVALTSFVENANANLYFKAKIYVKDKKFKIVLSSLETSPIKAMPNTRVTIIGENINSKVNQSAKELALIVIRDISTQLNKKPDNDF